MSYKEEYRQLLLNPRWQKRRLDILGRDKFTCQVCGDDEKTLHVHHKYYVTNNKPWEYPDRCFVTLCAECHAFETEQLPGACKDLSEAFKRLGFDSEQISSIAIEVKNLVIRDPMVDEDAIWSALIEFLYNSELRIAIFELCEFARENRTKRKVRE
jgi:hypothetical protein